MIKNTCKTATDTFHSHSPYHTLADCTASPTDPRALASPLTLWRTHTRPAHQQPLHLAASCAGRVAGGLHRGGCEQAASAASAGCPPRLLDEITDELIVVATRVVKAVGAEGGGRGRNVDLDLDLDLDLDRCRRRRAIFGRGM